MSTNKPTPLAAFVTIIGILGAIVFLIFLAVIVAAGVYNLWISLTT